MSRFFILFVLSLLLAVFSTIVNAKDLPPISVSATFKVLKDGEDFSYNSSYDDQEFELYPEPSPELNVVPALFKDATIAITNEDSSSSVTLVFILSAGVVYNSSDPSDGWRATSVTLPDIKITEKGQSDAVFSLTIGPLEKKELKLVYEKCSDAFTVGTVLTIQAMSETTKLLYEPIDVELDLECTIEECGSECALHGECIKPIGYCRCQDDWLGGECNYRGNFSSDICPGDLVKVHISFSTSQCDGYFGIYDYYNQYQSIVYMDFPRDNCIIGDPWPGDGSFFDGELATYLTPGKYIIYLAQQYGKPSVASFDLNVKSWLDCGSDYTCKKDDPNRCSGNGDCDEENPVDCKCDAGFFWNDCSGGCKALTFLNESSGIIDSDPNASSYGRGSMYVENAYCVWIINPPKADIINLEFDEFNLDGGSDFLAIRAVSEDLSIDLNSEPLYKMTGTKYPNTLSIPRERIALIFESDYTIFSTGFKIKYTSRDAPLEGKYIAAITVCSVFAFIVIIFLVAFLLIRNKKKRDDELSAALEATSLPWVLSPEEDEVETTAKENVRVARLKLNDIYGIDDMEDDSGSEKSDDETVLADERTESTVDYQSSSKKAKEKSKEEDKKSDDSDKSVAETKEKRREAGLDREAFIKSMDETDEELGWLDLGCLGIECDQHWPRFGLEQGATCPVMEDLKTKLTLSNSSESPISFCFFHPVDDEKFSISLCPGRGTIPPDTSITVTMNFRLFYTTFVFDHVKLAIYSANKVRGDFEGFDPYIDEEEGTLKTPIATARLGLSLEGSVSERIDPYEITLRPGTLGVGAFGTVYTGKYRQRIVAVKVMTRQADMMAQIKEEFEKEIELYRRLRNPLLVDFIGASLIPGKLCVATELIRHGSLENMMSAGEIPFVLQTRFAHNIAEAVSYLHSNNVLYRDLKPSNVMIVSFSLNAKINCKIGDFGTARNVADVEEFFLYTAGQGTPIYMAPEVLANKEYNSRADVYSFAISLWQMLSRQRPWDNVPVWEFPQRVINGVRPPLPDKETLDSMSVTDDYVRLIKSCWDNDPRKRPAFANILSTLGPICKTAKQAFKESGQRINPRMYPVVGDTGALLLAGEGGEEEESAKESNTMSMSEATTNARNSSSRGHKMPTSLRKQTSSTYISSGSSANTRSGYEGKRPRNGFTMTLADAMNASGTTGDSSMHTGNPTSSVAVRSTLASSASRK